STFANRTRQYTFSMFTQNNKHNYPKRDEYLLNCTSSNMTITCPSNYPPTTFNTTTITSSNRTCPEYFRFIHEDLKTWKKQGITRKMVESLKKSAHFRLVIVNGTAYVKQYSKAFQTRDVFTLWGILQLLKLYPGRLPDLDLMPEINIKPWVPLEKDLKDGNTIKNWSSREPYAFWKGNIHTGARHKLGQCNSVKDWNARIVNQNWGKEVAEGFKNSDLYKIYMEGNAWSVSEKYILACDSMTLLINPRYYDFLARSLIPMKHYWPVNPNNLCKSIKFAVDWGNNNTNKMENVYDYMFHVLYEYAKLLRYRPKVPDGAVELCSQKFACSPMGLETKYKIETMVNGPSKQGPCELPPPYDPYTLQSLRDQNAKIKEIVEMWEKGRG
ncbi:KDEL motif-containing protein 2, partial [Bienertia sinuspersici]